MSAPKFAIGNWKMNGLRADQREIDALIAAHPDPGCGVVICPPATLIADLARQSVDSKLSIGGQDCHADAIGAHTGDTSAEMLADVGAAYVILGHSERRTNHRETDAEIAAKVTAAWRADLVAVLCVGETEAERDAGATLSVLSQQIAGSLPAGANPARTIIAYEPVWAIGTGRVAETAQIAEAHKALRDDLTKSLGAAAASAIPILYGGSVKPANAAEIFAVPNVDGALVGGASLKAADFGAIIAALEGA
ncbi:MAG: triose-phosphate isomerase [Pseudomonadota bacterium]